MGPPILPIFPRFFFEPSYSVWQFPHGLRQAPIRWNYHTSGANVSWSDTSHCGWLVVEVDIKNHGINKDPDLEILTSWDILKKTIWIICVYIYIHIYITFFLKGAVFSLRFKKLLCQIWRHSFSQFVGGEKKNKLLKTTSWGWIFSFNGTSSSFNRSKNCSFKCQRILNGTCQRMTLATTEMDGGSWMDIDLSYGKLT